MNCGARDITLFCLLELLVGGTLAQTEEPAVPVAQVDAAKKAKDLFDRGKYFEAEAIYERILKVAPDNVYVLSNLGATQFRLQKFTLAENTFKRALAIAPNDELCHCTLGIVYYFQRKLDDSIRSLSRALIINPDNSTARDYIMLAADQKESGNEARVVITRPPIISGSGDFLTPLEKSRLRVPRTSPPPLTLPGEYR